ncbi:MAG TPA: condensation domain-containing protein [Pyrinomonadaceae bacterium]
MKNVETFYPLSPMQEGMLFHTLVAPGSGVYVRQVSCRLAGDVNIAAFERAWQHMVARHPSLRTFFVWQDVKSPVQVVQREVTLPLERMDWRGQAPAEQQNRLQAFLNEDRVRGFDLARAPLMRLRLIQLEDAAYHFVWSFHHLLLDGWSVFLLSNELTACVVALSQGKPLPALPPARPYRDYIVWLQQQDKAQAEAFWRASLKGVSAPTPLPMKPAGAAGGQAVEQQQVRLSAAETTALQAFARQHKLTLNTLIQGAWALLLSHHGQQSDVIFGMAVSGRPAELAGVEAMIGLFINTLPMRVHVAPAEPLAAWLAALQAQQVEARRYEYSALVQIQGWSEIPRGLSMFDSMLGFHNFPRRAAGSDAGAGSSLLMDDVRSTIQIGLPLEIDIAPAAELGLTMRYACERFDAATIARLLADFAAVLRAMVTRAAAPVSEVLNVMTTADRQQQAQQAEQYEDAVLQKLKGIKRHARTGGRARGESAGGTGT